MEAERFESKKLDKYRREHVLPRMLLHVVVAAAPVERAVRGADGLPEPPGNGRSYPLIDHVRHFNVVAPSPIAWLAAGGRIERSGVEVSDRAASSVRITPASKAVR